ncbi:MAG: P-II family nitrogen regulator [Chloroflexi bacterium]|nr:P-II family nitrogen regulator [Chloroflexota bacterium]
MKQITATIQPHRLSNVVRALHQLPHFPGFTIWDARGQGRGRGAGGAFKVTEDSIDYHRKNLLQITCADELVTSIVETIQKSAHTGNPGDGLIVVTDVAEVIRIRTGEKQDHAL